MKSPRLLAAAALLTSSLSQAAVLLYEPFDYGTGAIAGKGGSELGFDGGSLWTENSTKTTNVQEATLAFGTLVTSGGEFRYNVASGTDLNRYASRDMSVSVPTGDLFVTYIMTGPNGGRLNGGVYINGTEALQEFGALRSQYNPANSNGVFEPHVYYGGESAITTVNISNGPTYMYVQQYTGLRSGSGGTTQLWVINAANYDAIAADGLVTAAELDLNSVQSTPVLTLAGAAPTLDGSENLRLHFHDNGSANTDYVLDEIRIATTLGDAMAIPEPSASVLLGLGAIALLRRRRRA